MTDWIANNLTELGSLAAWFAGKRLPFHEALQVES